VRRDVSLFLYDSTVDTPFEDEGVLAQPVDLKPSSSVQDEECGRDQEKSENENMNSRDDSLSVASMRLELAYRVGQ